MKRRYCILLVILFFLSIFIIMTLSEDKQDLHWIEKKIIQKDDTFKAIIYTQTKKPYIYVFYKSNSNSIGLGLIEVSGRNQTHIFGTVPIDSNIGFTYGSGESKKLSQYILYGAISNTEITQVLVKGTLSNLVKNNEFYLWFHISEQPFNSTSIMARDRAGVIVFEKEKRSIVRLNKSVLEVNTVSLRFT
ncbi:hypothetical protein [Paenibacillus sp. NEAU-GSW1]|uniref:hypothetical protein n=1 Tax=Paenibacillus sp. NEAU-GSW1 TaxID=2682486 RepID=UPI0012E31F37|nr:hypothetical protein [Paenibacillus sp. NEAU-GSW1]MUT67550.1 hypothetical protein [Paenibacillus sp. NEAU-GSW1]